MATNPFSRRNKSKTGGGREEKIAEHRKAKPERAPRTSGSAGSCAHARTQSAPRAAIRFEKGTETVTVHPSNVCRNANLLAQDGFLAFSSFLPSFVHVHSPDHLDTHGFFPPQFFLFVRRVYPERVTLPRHNG